MDATAISQCMEHGMPILVFNYRRDGNVHQHKAENGEGADGLAQGRSLHAAMAPL
jgi:uridylate kinase